MNLGHRELGGSESADIYDGTISGEPRPQGAGGSESADIYDGTISGEPRPQGAGGSESADIYMMGR